jgi:hypothetical protein
MITQSLCLYQSIPQDKKHSIMEENPNCKSLVEYVLSKDMLNQWGCINNYSFTLQKYIELMYRWAFYFKGEQLCQLILKTYFSQNSLGNLQHPEVIECACQNLKRTCMQNMPHISSQDTYVKQIISNCFEGIGCLHKSLANAFLQSTVDCLSSLYNLMGLLAQKI